MANITKRTNSKGITTYYFRVCVGRNELGEQIRVSDSWVVPSDMTPYKAKKIAEQKALEFETKALGNEISEKIKFEEFSKKWLKSYAEKQLRLRTIESNKQMLKRVNKEIGHLYLDNIKPTTLIALYEKLEEPRYEKTYSLREDINLKDLLHKNNILIKQVAKKSKVALDTINRLENGKRVSFETAKRISDSVNLEVKDLFRKHIEEKVYSAKTIRNYHALIRKILGTAVMWQYIPSNPCERVQPPRVKRQEAYCMTEEEVQIMLNNLPNLPIELQAFFFISLDTGARRGELLGLTWEDIDFNKHTIDINKANLYLPNFGIFTDETKNEYSNRIVKVSSSSMLYLQRLLDKRKKQSELLGTAWNNSNNNCFVDDMGNPINPNYMTAKFRQFVRESGLNDKIHLHTLRHTSASLLVFNNINLKAVSSRLGHASTQTTAMIYEHQIRRADDQASEVLEKVLASPRLVLDSDNNYKGIAK